MEELTTLASEFKTFYYKVLLPYKSKLIEKQVAIERQYEVDVEATKIEYECAYDRVEDVNYSFRILRGDMMERIDKILIDIPDKMRHFELKIIKKK